MKKVTVSTLMFYLLGITAALMANPQYNLRFELLKNDGHVGGNFEVKVQMNADIQDIALGTSNFVFTYNTDALETPVMVKGPDFNSGIYQPATLGEPVSGRLSINIELAAPSQGVNISTDFIDLATIAFKIADSSANAALAWRVEIPNATVVFADDEQSILKAGQLSGMDIVLPIADGPGNEGEIIKDFIVFQNYPNPFNPVTHIKYGLPKQDEVTVAVYNVQGQLVQTLFRGTQSAGYHILGFDGADIASGVYFYRVQTSGQHVVKKMLLMK